ncbi:MAG TPA: hypothetical protein VF713_17990, partial [Thermoanaerobaculia bacterium]
VNLYAMGGRGKTAAIRWLIARTCVPRCIPAVKIDFDFPPEGAPRPAAFLREIVRQLDEQLSGTVYFELRNELDDYVQTATGGGSFDDPYLGEMTNRFASALREARGSATTLIILDTVEEAMLGAGGELLRGFMHLLREAHREAPAIRLLLSGRYSIWEEERIGSAERKRVEEIDDFRAETADVEIVSFNDSEARRYLIERRKLADSAMIPAIVGGSGGMPFKLSLYADIVKDEPGVNIEELVMGGSVELTYLILRVVRRLKDPRLQWVLRYGVVPRKLTIGFVREVAPYLLDAMLGPIEFDKPLDNLPPQLRENVFRQGLLTKEQSLQVDELWAALVRYAAERSWVTAESGDMLRFHAEVLQPMRRLLRDNPIFRTLHERSAEYHDRLGNARESAYHRLQIAMPDASAYWRTAVTRAIEAEQPDEVRFLAVDVPEGHELRQEAWRREAQALLHIARLRGASDAAWDEAKRAGERAGDEAVAAAVALNSGDAHSALRLLANLRPSGEQESLNLALLRGSAHAALGEFENASVAYDEARDIALHVGAVLEWPRVTIQRLTSFTRAEQYAAAGRYDEAFEIFNEVGKDPDVQFASEAALRAANLQIRLGTPSLALKTLARASQDDVRRRILEAEVALLRFSPIEALVLLPEVKGDFVNQARTAQLRAQIYARMFEVDEARAAWESALSLWREAAQRAGRPEIRFAHTACLADAAYTEIDEFEDRLRAKGLIAQLNRASSPEDLNAGFHAIALDALSSAGLGALRIMKEATTPALRIAAAIILLRKGLGLREELDLPGALASIRSTWTRLALLHGLKYVPDELDDPSRARVFDLVPRITSTFWKSADSRSADAATRVFELVEAYRVFGERNKASSLIEEASSRLELWDRPLLSRVVMSAMRRLGIRHQVSETAIEHWRQTLGEHPDFLATLLLEAGMTIGNSHINELAMEAHRKAQSRTVRRRIVQYLSKRNDADVPPTAEGDFSIGNPLNVNIGESRDVVVLTGFANTAIIGSETPSEADSHSNEIVIHVEDVDSEKGEVVTRLPDGQQLRATRRPLELFEPGRSYGSIPYSAVKMIEGDTERTLRLLRDWLLDPRVNGALPSKARCDLRVELPSSLQSFPWEIAIHLTTESAFRSLYRSLSSHEVDFDPEPRLPPNPRVLVINRSRSTELAVQRGRGQLVYDDPVTVLTDPTADRVREALASDVDLIHISSSFGESVSAGSVFLQFGSREMELAAMVPQSFSPGDVAVAAATLKKRPIVVLDATLPRGDTECVRQLMLRNVFAADLFATGSFQAVIASGLFDDSGPWARFAKELRRGSRAGDLVPLLRYADQKATLAGRLATQGVAFFSQTAGISGR